MGYVYPVYLREISKVKLLTREREIKLARRVQRRDKRAREQMITANLRLVVKIARDYEHLGLPLLDLINEGNTGLMKGVERFNPDKGAKHHLRGVVDQAIDHRAGRQGQNDPPAVCRRAGQENASR